MAVVNIELLLVETTDFLDFEYVGLLHKAVVVKVNFAFCSDCYGFFLGLLWYLGFGILANEAMEGIDVE